MIKGVIFDWNGTLSNDTRRLFAVSMRAVKKVGGKPFKTIAEFKKKVRNPWYPFYRDDLGCHVPKRVVYKWFCYYLKRERLGEKLFPDAIPLLKFLKAKGIKIGIVSSYPVKSLRKEIKSHGISDLLGLVRGDCHTKAEHIRTFLKLHGFSPHEVIFIGDMVNDIDEGRKCGVFTAAHLRGNDSRKKLSQSKPDIVLPTLSALKKYV